MPRYLATLAACLVAAAHAAEPPAAPPPAQPAPLPKRLPAVSLLPNDSTLQHVLIPRFDKQRRLLAVLRADHMRVIDADNATGTKVNIELHRPEGGLRGIIDLQEGQFDQKAGLLRGSHGAVMRSDTLKAVGTGTVYDLERSRGFLLGPVNTLFYPRTPATSMSCPAQLPSLRALLVASLAILPAAAPASPAPPDSETLARFERDTRPAAVDCADKNRSVDSQLAATAVKSGGADTELAAFLHDTALTAVLADTKPAKPKDPVPPKEPVPAKEPIADASDTIDPNLPGTHVLADAGMFFDSAQGILVYLKNIRLTDPRFDLWCTDELKVFFAKKPEAATPPGTATGSKSPSAKPPAADSPPPKGPPKPPPADAPKPHPAADTDNPPTADAANPPPAEKGKPQPADAAKPQPADAGKPPSANAGKSPPADPNNPPKTAPPANSLLGGDFGDIDHLVATGSVRVVRKNPEGLPVTSTADTATYEAATGNVIMRGGFPTLHKGKDYLRALEPGLYVILYGNGDVFAQPGKWETGVADINEKQKDKPADQKPAGQKPATQKPANPAPANTKPAGPKHTVPAPTSVKPLSPR